ncbi:MAG: tetratricopeptide (TPR) repeat protein [Salibacteraceae bacterium]|jgi:tetratricopeptide (TPR) repeat protein
MKNIVVALMLVTISGGAFAQGAKVTSAGNYWKTGDYRKAKMAIDAASKHPKTSQWPRTWAYMGKIYYSIAIDTTSALADIRENSIFVSADAFEKVVAKPDSKTKLGEIKMYLYQYVYNKIWDDGVGFYNGKDYVNASRNFARCADIRAVYEILDTTGYYYAANASAAAEDHERAITLYSKIKGSGYEDGAIYSKMAGEYKAMGDTVNAVAVIGEGRAAFPENQSLLIAEFNLYVEMDETEKAISNIDKAIEANPTKAPYFYVRGKLKESLSDLTGAESDYKKTIEIDSNHLDANHDLGAMFVNQSITVVDEMNALPYSDTKGYDAKKKELEDIYGLALPYLEKAYELDPSDAEVQGILKKLYLRSKDMESYNKLQKEIEAATGSATE